MVTQKDNLLLLSDAMVKVGTSSQHLTPLPDDCDTFRKKL
jgi:hypothetical protein